MNSPSRPPEPGADLPAVPDPAGGDPEEAVEWHCIAPDGSKQGPTVPTLFAGWIAQGRVRHDWMLWRTGWTEWKPAGEVEHLLPRPLVVDNAEAIQVSKKPNARKSVSYAQKRRASVARRRSLTIVLGLIALVMIVALAVLLVSQQ